MYNITILVTSGGVSQVEKCFFSNRIYKKDLPEKDVSAIQDALLIFNKAKHSAYKFFLDEYNYNLKYDISIHLQIKNKYGLNDYFANSAVQAAKVVISSQKELNSQYQKDLNHQIKTRQKKIKDISKKINKKEKVLTKLSVHLAAAFCVACLRYHICLQALVNGMLGFG